MNVKKFKLKKSVTNLVNHLSYDSTRISIINSMWNSILNSVMDSVRSPIWISINDSSKDAYESIDNNLRKKFKRKKNI